MTVIRLPYLIAQTDRPFVENGGQEIFEAIEKFRELEEGDVDTRVCALVGRFAELDRWADAEKAFTLSSAGFSAPTDVLDTLGNALAKEEDPDRLRHWCELVGDTLKQDLLFTYCRFFGREKITPRSETLDVAHESSNDEEIRSVVIPFLVTGYWAHGRKEEALTVLRSADLEPRGQSVAVEIIRWALANNEPELAIELIPLIRNRMFALSAYSWYAAILASDPAKRANLNKWLKAQPSEVQLAARIGMARQLLGSRFEVLVSEFSKN